MFECLLGSRAYDVFFFKLYLLFTHCVNYNVCCLFVCLFVWMCVGFTCLWYFISFYYLHIVLIIIFVVCLFVCLFECFIGFTCLWYFISFLLFTYCFNHNVCCLFVCLLFVCLLGSRAFVFLFVFFVFHCFYSFFSPKTNQVRLFLLFTSCFNYNVCCLVVCLFVCLLGSRAYVFCLHFLLV